LVYAFATIIAYVGLDFFIKKASGKIDDFAGAFLINLFALIPVLLIYIWLKVTNHSMLFTKEGVMSAIFAGLSVGIGSITFIKVFSSGANLSIGSPVVRIGTIVLITLISLFVLKESLTAKQLIGLALSLVGLVLVTFK